MKCFYLLLATVYGRMKSMYGFDKMPAFGKEKINFETKERLLLAD